jgi:hypothetical protein
MNAGQTTSADVRSPASDLCQQLGLFTEDKTIAERFEAWKATAGGRHVLRHAYRITAWYGERFVRCGQRVSMKLVWELLRDKLDWIRAGLKRRGIVLTPEHGFALNNDFTASVARHILAHKPEWRGLFEIRGAGAAAPGSALGNIESRLGGTEQRRRDCRRDASSTLGSDCRGAATAGEVRR